MFVRLDVCPLADDKNHQRLLESRVHKVVIVLQSKLPQRYQMVQCPRHFVLNPLLSDY